MAFSNIENSEKLDIINIAIIDNEELKNDKIFKEAFKTLEDEENNDRLFNIKYTSEEEAKKLLQNDEIVGFMILQDNEPKITFMQNGINETIFKFVTEEISQTSETVKNLSEEEIKSEIMSGNHNLDYEKIYKDILEMVEKQEGNVKDISSNNLSYTMIEFYTLIAMTCLYGGILGMTAINQNLANMSNTGKRMSVSPTHKIKVVLSSALASYATQLIGLLILFLYTIFVLKVDYGTNLPLIILLGIIRKFIWIVNGNCSSCFI